VIRYAKNIILKINLDIDKQETIDVPYLYIDYRERTASYIADDSLSTVSFNTEYMMSTTSFWKGASAVFITLMVLFGLILLTVTIVMFNRP
jgi:hypothetical protein